MHPKVYLKLMRLQHFELHKSRGHVISCSLFGIKLSSTADQQVNTNTEFCLKKMSNWDCWRLKLTSNNINFMLGGNLLKSSMNRKNGYREKTVSMFKCGPDCCWLLSLHHCDYIWTCCFSQLKFLYFCEPTFRCVSLCMYVSVSVWGSKQGGGGVELRVRSREVARQRRGRHVLLQGFLTSAQNMMQLFMQVNLSTSTRCLVHTQI